MSTVKVSVRCRPCNDISNDLTLLHKSINITVSGVSSEFQFDEVLNDQTSQEMVFRKCVSPIIDKAMDGFNGCVFAYGQTGAGTYDC